MPKGQDMFKEVRRNIFNLDIRFRISKYFHKYIYVYYFQVCNTDTYVTASLRDKPVHLSEITTQDAHVGL